ncbi:MAG: diadenylate cyclase [Candidatus Omnitrophota bacterium]|nr:diadenylate cyclase [Candidatus Omnitrophota bacterium]
MIGINWMNEIGLSGFLDILFMWFAVYVVLVWSKKTRAASVLTGILIVAGIYLVTRQLNMVLAAGLLEKFFAIILIALVVIFQEELRHFFEQIAVWSLRKRIGKIKPQSLSLDEVDILVRTLIDLAKEKVGALIVIRGKDLIVRHLGDGIDLDGKISEALLKSLFDAGSIGHDGAVYIEGTRIIRFSCHLPLSKDLKSIGKGGTRHAAALGLAELSDALCLVVSEERGTISVACHGNITVISDPEHLRNILTAFYEAVHPKIKVKPWEGFLKKNSKEKLLGFLLASAIWFVLVYGSKQTYRTFTVPVSYPPMKAALVMAEVKPDKVYVTLGGPRSSFFFLAPKKIKFIVSPEAKKGTQKVRIYPSDFEFPKDLTMEVLAPQEIEFRIADRPAPENKSEENSSQGLMDKVKKVLPLVKSEPEAAKPAPSSSETPVPAPAQNEQKAKQTEKVPYLEDAKPEEVVKYLEEKLEGHAVIEPLKSKNPENQKQEKA